MTESKKAIRQKFVMGNWKMNGDLPKAEDFFKFLLNFFKDNLGEKQKVDISLAIPSVYLKSVFDLFRKDFLDPNSFISLAAQNLNEHDFGAYTGELSAKMLLEVGAKYVIVGHSERRQYYAESDLQVGQKAKQAASAGLIPVICIGETLAVRESGETEKVLKAQLDAIIEVAGVAVFERGVLAYEPVWAIGTGLAATPLQVQSVHAFLRKLLEECDKGIAQKTRIVYGGSLKPSNAKEIFGLDDVDGGLIGGASLDLENFLSIAQS